MPPAAHGGGDRAAVVVLVALLVVAVLLGGCGTTGTPAPVDAWSGSGPVPSGYYQVRDGDTLYSIATKRKLDYRQVARWNNIGSSYRIYTGKLLRVVPPGRTASGSASQRGNASGSSTTKKTAAKITTAPKSAARRSRTTKTSSRAGKTASKTAKKRGTTKTASAAAGSGVTWRWPLSGKVTQTFRSSERTRQGIRISGRAGQMVLSAGPGSVVYSGSGLKGYGNLIIVKHNKKYLSAYGFNRRLMVKEGDRVKGGQSLAEVGQAPDGAHILHFEIRRNGTAVDPLRYLPRSR